MKYFYLLLLFILAGGFIFCVFFECYWIFYNDCIEAGNFEEAIWLIENKWFYKKDCNEVFCYLELGVLACMQGDFVKSNEYFNKVDLFIEDRWVFIGL